LGCIVSRIKNQKNSLLLCIGDGVRTKSELTHVWGGKVYFKLPGDKGDANGGGGLEKAKAQRRFNITSNSVGACSVRRRKHPTQVMHV